MLPYLVWKTEKTEPVANTFFSSTSGKGGARPPTVRVNCLPLTFSARNTARAERLAGQVGCWGFRVVDCTRCVPPPNCSSVSYAQHNKQQAAVVPEWSLSGLLGHTRLGLLP